MSEKAESNLDSKSGLLTLFNNIYRLPSSILETTFRHGVPTSDRTRSQAIFSNFFLHTHSTRVHPHSLKLTTTWGLGVILASLFIILTVTGLLLMVYYVPSTENAYNSIKDIHTIVPFGGLMRNIHRWSAHLMVACAFLHMARVFYTSAYKSNRAFNWCVGVILLVLTLALSFTGYLLPWDQLAYWAVVIGANIAASPNEVVHALGLPEVFNVGDIQRELLLGASEVGQQALTRFYLLHVIVLPLALTGLVGLHFWRIRKDGGLIRPGGTPTQAGQGARAMETEPLPTLAGPNKSFGLMCVIKDKQPHVKVNPDETVPSWPYLLRAEALVFMFTILACLALGYLYDAPLKEFANPSLPENPAKAPWYFLGLQEMVSYSAFVGGIGIPTFVVIALLLLPFLDREKENPGVWFSGRNGRRAVYVSAIFAALAAISAVAVPVQYGWLRNWIPDIPQIFIILFNPGSILAVTYVIWSLFVLVITKSTRKGAIAFFTCFIVSFIILTYVGTFMRGPNWAFFWSKADWPLH